MTTTRRPHRNPSRGGRCQNRGLFLAPRGGRAKRRENPLLKLKRTKREVAPITAVDPSRTS